MTDWKPDLRHQKTIGTFTLTPERRGSETAHHVGSEDGRGLRVLPSDHVSGLKRSQVALEALMALQDLMWLDCQHDEHDHPEADPYVYLVGAFTLAGLEWESVGSSPSIEEWLAEGMEAGWAGPGAFLADLRRAGFEIRRAE